MQSKKIFSKLFFFIGLVTLSNCPAQESTADASSGLVIIDTHAHILPTDSTLNEQYLEDLVTAAKAAGVSKMALGLHARQEPDRDPTYSAEHDTWVLAAYEKYPDFIIPMLAGFDPADANAPTYVEEQLKTGKWQGIGELDLRNSVKKTTTTMNDPTMMTIYALAATYDVPVMIHYDFCYETDCDNGKAEYEDALTAHPNTKFISAHGCQTDLMEQYDNLYCEYEIVAPSLPATTLSSRVMMGTDIQRADLSTQGTSNTSQSQYDEVIAIIRERLETLDATDAQKMANGTAEELFNL